MDRTKEKAEYARIYGTMPCAHELLRLTPDYWEAYLGSRIENNTIVFMFSALSLSDSLAAGSTIEHHFRARLSRKVSMNFGTDTFSVPFSNDPDELDDYMTAMFDLELYFRGIEDNPRLLAEITLHNQEEDWRDRELLTEVMLTAQKH